jgi:hypothetical protein
VECCAGAGGVVVAGHNNMSEGCREYKGIGLCIGGCCAKGVGD